MARSFRTTYKGLPPQSPALANGIALQPLVLPQNMALDVLKITGLRDCAPGGQDSAIVAVGNKADILTIPLSCVDQASLLRQLADLGLGESPYRQQQPPQDLLGEGIEEIALVLLPVSTPQKCRPSAAAGSRQGVMAGGDIAGANGIRLPAEGDKFDVPVALYAGVRGKARLIGAGEIIHDLLVEQRAVIRLEEGDTQLVGYGLGVGCGLGVIFRI